MEVTLLLSVKSRTVSLLSIESSVSLFVLGQSNTETTTLASPVLSDHPAH